MKKLLSTIWFTILLGAMQISCIDQLSLSNLEWGILTYYKDAVLLKIPPKGKVTVCADRQQVGEYVAQSVLIWAKAIGRDKYITSKNDCDRSSDVTLTVQAAYEYVQTADTSYWEGKIRYNAFDSRYQQLPPMLHEVGHTWGLCDQYDGGLWNCRQSVSNAGTENSNRTSVMGCNYRSELAEDDIKGIKYIADLQGVGQNQQWKDFLASEDKSSVNTNTNDSKPHLFLKADGRWVDIFISSSKSLTYCVGPDGSCNNSSNQKKLDKVSLNKAGTVYKITYIDPSRLQKSSPLNLYQDGKLVRSFYLNSK